MCNINFNLISKRNYGYKVVAVDKDNNIFSIFTGQPYNIGVVLPPPQYAQPITRWNPIINMKPLHECGFYKKEYVGYTSAFTNMKVGKFFLIAKRKDIHKQFNKKYKLKLAKFTFEGDTYSGIYDMQISMKLGVDSYTENVKKVIAGNNIKSIEIL